MRTRATVAGLTSSAAPMAASVQPGPASPWLAFNRMRAWVSALAGATPRPIMVCSRARSSSDRTTMCRLRTSASCSGGIPGPHQHETEPHISQLTTDELLGVRWACEIAAYAELKLYVEDDASKTPSWISTKMLNQSLPNSAWAGTRMGAKAVWERVAGELEEQGPQ